MEIESSAFLFLIETDEHRAQSKAYKWGVPLESKDPRGMSYEKLY